jgi:hypothetical protein
MRKRKLVITALMGAGLIGALAFDERQDERRVGNVRDALINAGVPAYKIQTGAFGDPQLRRSGRVAVLLASN